MSYILDALKKSEQERELVRMLRTAGTAGFSWVPARRRLWPAIVILALFAGVTLTVLRWWPAQTPTSMANKVMTEPSLPAQAVVTRETPVRTSAPPATSPVVTAPSRSATDDLATQARVAASPSEPAPVARPPAPAQASGEPAAGQPANAPAPIDTAAVPLLREMPADFRRQLPALTLNIHLYSANEAENLVYINDRQLRRGEQLEGGIRLEQIVAEGVVLSYAGTYFKLPRPN